MEVTGLEGLVITLGGTLVELFVVVTTDGLVAILMVCMTVLVAAQSLHL